MFCFEICTSVGRGGEKGGSANFKTKHTETFTREIPSALYCTPEGRGLKIMSELQFEIGSLGPAVAVCGLFWPGLGHKMTVVSINSFFQAAMDFLCLRVKPPITEHRHACFASCKKWQGRSAACACLSPARGDVQRC